MSRETRLIVTLVALSAVGVGALAFMADQYKKRLTPRGGPVPAPATATAGTLRPDVPGASPDEDAAARATRLVSGFLAARQAAQGVCARQPEKVAKVAAAVTGNFEGVEGRRMGLGIDVIATYRIERFNGFAAFGMSYDDYAAARSAWRTWSAGGPVEAPLAAAFEAERNEAAKAGLGPYEALDDAIK